MPPIEIIVQNGTAFNAQSENSILNIEVTNENAIPCKEGTNAYYYITLSDSTNTATYVFAVPQTGEIPEDHTETFVVENLTLDEVSTSSGVIYYTPA